MPEPPCLEELNHLLERLSTEQRDELLQSLLIAASGGGEAVIDVLEKTLLSYGVEELLERHMGPRKGDGRQIDGVGRHHVEGFPE